MNNRRSIPASRNERDNCHEINHDELDRSTKCRQDFSDCRHSAYGMEESKTRPHSAPGPYFRDKTRVVQLPARGSPTFDPPVDYTVSKSSPRYSLHHQDDPANSVWTKARRGNTPRSISEQPGAIEDLWAKVMRSSSPDDLWARSTKGSSADTQARRKFQGSGAQRAAHSRARLGASDAVSDSEYIHAQVQGRSNLFRTDKPAIQIHKRVEPSSLHVQMRCGRRDSLP